MNGKLSIFTATPVRLDCGAAGSELLRSLRSGAAGHSLTHQRAVANWAF